MTDALLSGLIGAGLYLLAGAALWAAVDGLVWLFDAYGPSGTAGIALACSGFVVGFWDAFAGKGGKENR